MHNENLPVKLKYLSYVCTVFIYESYVNDSG